MRLHRKRLKMITNWNCLRNSPKSLRDHIWISSITCLNPNNPQQVRLYMISFSEITSKYRRISLMMAIMMRKLPQVKWEETRSLNMKKTLASTINTLKSITKTPKSSSKWQSQFSIQVVSWRYSTRRTYWLYLTLRTTFICPQKFFKRSNLMNYCPTYLKIQKFVSESQNRLWRPSYRKYQSLK